MILSPLLSQHVYRLAKESIWITLQRNFTSHSFTYTSLEKHCSVFILVEKKSLLAYQHSVENEENNVHYHPLVMDEELKGVRIGRVMFFHSMIPNDCPCDPDDYNSILWGRNPDQWISAREHEQYTQHPSNESANFPHNNKQRLTPHFEFVWTNKNKNMDAKKTKRQNTRVFNSNAEWLKL